MFSVLLQIVGGFFLVFVVIRRNLKDIAASSAVTISDGAKIQRIERLYKETWLNRFGFSYLFLGLVFSLKDVSDLGPMAFLSSNWLVALSIGGILLLIGFVVPQIFLSANKKRIAKLAEERQNGETWTT